MKQSETKHLHEQWFSNKEVFHNQYYKLKDDLLSGISVGDRAFERIGDKIHLKGISVKMNIENEEFRPYVRYMFIVFRDRWNHDHTQPDAANDIWEGTSTSKNLDWLNTNRFEFKMIKYVNVTAYNSGTAAGVNSVTQPIGGTYKIEAGEDYEIFTNPSKYVNFYLKFNKNITYDDNSTNAMRNKWQFGVVPYVNYATNTSSATKVGNMTGVAKLYWKDM